MVLRTYLRWGCSGAAALCTALAVVCAGPKSEQVLQTQLFKQAGEQEPVELASGDLLIQGDELYMTVKAQRSLHVYVVSEDAAGQRLIIYPCRTWGRSPQLAADQQYRLPGREGFWPVRSVTPRERLLVIASVRSMALLDAAFLAAESPEPCAAPVDGTASHWIDSLMDPSRGSFRPLWRAWGRKPETWISSFDLKGAASHG